MWVNLTFYLHFGEETYPISQFNNNNLLIIIIMHITLKKQQKRTEQQYCISVLINNDAALDKTLLKFVYQKIHSDYIFLNTERFGRKRCQDFSSKFS